MACIFINWFPIDFLGSDANAVVSVAVWMILWWVFEVVSISVTALIPILTYPLLGIKTFSETTMIYGSPIVFLFMGGFFLALAMEKVSLHRRLALYIIRFCGTDPSGLLVGFIFSTAFLSMWISNTATTLVLMPIGLTVANYLIQNGENQPEGVSNFKIAILISIAFAANIGGTATIIGTPPNVVLVGFMESELSQEITFLKWTSITIPFTLLMLFACWATIKKILPYSDGTDSAPNDLIEKEIEVLGPVRIEELKVATCFGITILLWMFRTQFNSVTSLSLSNGEIAMWGGISTFLVPVSQAGNKHSWLLEWTDTQKMQWGILVMFGGGLALASGLSDSGIIQLIGGSLKSSDPSPIRMVIFLVVIMTLMTTVMSNVALVAVFAPILSGISQGLDMGFLELGIPVALASSCAFMLPMSTPPNAIVYTSGVVKVYHMLKVGFFLNVISISLLAFMGWVLIKFL